MKSFFIAGLIGCALVSQAGAAADPLGKWAETIDSPQTQQTILQKVFSGQIGPMSQARLNKETGIYLFPKNSNWVRLEKGTIYVPPTAPGGPYFVATCIFYNEPSRGPVSAVSYVFYDTTSRPDAISGGYAGDEMIADVKLPKLGKRFVALVDQFGMPNRIQTSALVIELRKGSPLRKVWISPNSQHQFQLGFDTLGGKEERLIFRATRNGQIQYSAYRWDGSRFEPDSFASETVLKSLPDEVWQYGTPPQ